MSNTLVTIIAIGLVAVLMFTVPVLTMADRVDTVSQTKIETLTSDFVNEIKTTGKLTKSAYSKFEEDLTALGNTYDVEVEIKKIDENPGKKTTQAKRDKIGENLYYSIYTSQVLEDLDKSGYINLNEGDIVSTTVRNTNLTLAQQMKNFLYKITGNDSYTIRASQSGLVTATGNQK